MLNFDFAILIPNMCECENFQKYSAYKYHWSGIGLPTQLEITPCSLDQLDPTSNKVIASYDYKDIVATIGK